MKALARCSRKLDSGETSVLGDDAVQVVVSAERLERSQVPKEDFPSRCLRPSFPQVRDQRFADLLGQREHDGPPRLGLCVLYACLVPSQVIESEVPNIAGPQPEPRSEEQD